MNYRLKKGSQIFIRNIVSSHKKNILTSRKMKEKRSREHIKVKEMLCPEKSLFGNWC
jgi:hypothetical protein